MAIPASEKKFLFVINSGSGNKETDCEAEVVEFFKKRKSQALIYRLPKKPDVKAIKKEIEKTGATHVIAVGGDGTLKMVAECLQGTDLIAGVIPAGSANGMAKELGMPTGSVPDALEVIVREKVHRIHLVMVNKELCIHLADMGFNAYLVQKFDTLPQRGMWGYTKAAFHALVNHQRMDVEMTIAGEQIKTKAAMVAIANATRYGTGLKINPDGKLDDEVFEVVVVKDYSYFEILKIWLTNIPFNPEKIEVYQTDGLKIFTRHSAHFQVDGEYLGKVNKVSAKILPAALNVITGPAYDETAQ